MFCPPLRQFFGIALLLTFAGACTGAEQESASDEVIARIAAELAPTVVLEGEDMIAWTIEERLSHHNVPGVSIAVIQNGRVAWAQGFGIADTDTGAAVTTETLFQAASMSKPVAALAALSLVEDGILALDAPVNDYLTSWRLPDNEFTADSAVTLRGLLTHSAGLTVWGFPGYRKDQPFAEAQVLAVNAQVLDGEGNTDPVRVYKVPGTSWQYSGGGYTVMEQMSEDASGMSFPDLLAERVLVPAGMTHSTYAQPLPEALWDRAARGHRGDGEEVEGEWHTYPEQAAAGLWTTPTDLATVSVHLLGILDGSVSDGVLSLGMLEQMLSPSHDGAEGYNDWGLGFGLSTSESGRTFSHGGANAGFRANWSVNRDDGSGYVIMTNGDRGGTLAGEIARAIAVVYDWGGQPEKRARVRLDALAIEALEGEYEIKGLDDFIITFEAGADGTLDVMVPGQGTMTFYPSSVDEWFELSDGDVMVIQRDDDGNVTGAVNAGTTVMTRRIAQ